MSKVKAVATISTAFLVLATATAGYISDEGWVLKTYKDPISINTGCAGLTGARYGIEPDKTYTQAECEEKTALAMMDHYFDTRSCLPSNLPTDTHAAFLRFALNVGATKACGSTAFAKARAGDLRGACAGLSAWVYAGGKVLPGLVERRKRERAQCEKGLTP